MTTTAPTKAPHDGSGAPETDTPTTAVAPPRVAPLVRVGAAWDPFALMDRLDAQAMIAEMEGIATDVLVYRIKGDGGKEDLALSKGGIDECCTLLVSQGQCIREHDLTVNVQGDGENQIAFFQCSASRYAVHPDGREVRLDSVLGVKREPLYEQRAPVTLDSPVPGKKWRHLTYRDAADDYSDQGARSYLEWIRDRSTFDNETKAFVAAILNGEDVGEFALGMRFNNFWYEHGAMKAARNARARLIPAGLKAQVIAMAKAGDKGRVQDIERPEPVTPAQQATREKLAANEAKNTRKEERNVNRREPDRAAYAFPFGDLRMTPLDLKAPPGHEKAGQYVVGDSLLVRAQKWAEDCLSGKPFARPGSENKMPITDAERPKFEGMRDAMATEIEARRVEQEDAATSAEGGEPSANPTGGTTPATSTTTTSTGNGGTRTATATANEANDDANPIASPSAPAPGAHGGAVDMTKTGQTGKISTGPTDAVAAREANALDKADESIDHGAPAQRDEDDDLPF